VFEAAGAWSNDWAWSVPLIVLTVLAHTFGLAVIREQVVLPLSVHLGRHRTSFLLAALMVPTVLFVTFLHAIEAGAWAAAYVALGARADFASAMLYSLSAMTTFGHAEIFLAAHWRLMGAIEALNGVMLFGLTTAFLFAVIQRHWPAGH
jgi:Ion channel